MENRIVHFEIPTDDVDELKRFYQRIFDGKIERAPGPMDYWLIQTWPTDEDGNLKGPGVNGGLFKRIDPNQGPMNYVSVKSIDDHSSIIESEGGRIIVPKKEVTGVGFFAVALDPQNNPFAIWKSME